MTFNGLATLVLMLCLSEVIPFCSASSRHNSFLKVASRHNRAQRTHHAHHGAHRTHQAHNGAHHHSLARFKRTTDNTTALAVVKQQNTQSGMVLEEQNLIMQSNWEVSLISAPYAISLIGLLIVVSTEQDFGLHRSNNHSYTQLRQWRFQPALIQLSNYAWSSFHDAQRNTDRIRMLMTEIRRNTKQATEILQAMPAKAMIRFLKIPLGLVKESVAESIVLATQTEASFRNTMILLLEIAEAVTATKSENNQALIDMRIEIDTAQLDQKRRKVRKAIYQERLGKIEVKLEENRKQFEKALDKIPTGWEAVLMSFVQGLSPGNWLGGGGGGGGQQVTDTQLENEYASENAIHLSKNTVVILNKFLDKLDKWLIKIKEGSAEVESQKFRKDIENYLVTLIEGAKMNQDNMGDMSQNVELQPLVAMMKKFTSIFENLKTNMQEKPNEIKKNLQSVKTKLAPILNTAKTFASRGAQGGSTSINALPSTDSGSSVGSNERFIAANRLTVLSNTEKRYDQLWNEVEQQNLELNRAILKLSQMQLNELSLNETQEMIHDTITNLSKLHTLWTALLDFFTDLASSVNVKLNKSVNKFAAFAEEIGKTTIEDRANKAVLKFTKQIMKDNCNEVVIITSSVLSITSAYVNASKLYIMPQLTGISGLQTLRGQDVAAMKLKLAENAKVAKGNIYKMAEKRKEEFKSLVKDQRNEIERIFQITRPPPAEELSALKIAENQAAPPLK